MIRTRVLFAMIAGTVLGGCHAARRVYPSAALPVGFSGFVETFQQRASDSGRTITLAVRVTGDSLVSILRGVYDTLVVQHIVAIFDTGRLRLRELRDSVPSRLEVLRYSVDRLHGTVIVQNRRDGLDTFHLSLHTDSATVDRRILLTSVRWLPLETGKTYGARMFDPHTQTVYPLRISIGPKATMAGPAGRTEAYRVELTTDPPSWFRRASYLFPTVLWVRADSSRRIVRIERPRLRAVFDLVAEEPAAP